MVHICSTFDEAMWNIYDPLMNSLKRIRSEKSLSRSLVEKELGLRSFILKDYESERLKLPTSEAIKLANYYNVSLDELLGVDTKSSFQLQGLNSLSSSFIHPSLSFITQDDLLFEYLRSHSELLLEKSIFDLLLIDHDKNLVLNFLFSSLSELMESDNKVTNCETKFIKNLETYLSYSRSLKVKFVSIQLSDELKHFFIWLLYLLAESDKKIVYQEVEYIDNFAIKIELNRNEYLRIKKHFVRE